MCTVHSIRIVLVSVVHIYANTFRRVRRGEEPRVVARQTARLRIQVGAGRLLGRSRGFVGNPADLINVRCAISF